MLPFIAPELIARILQHIPYHPHCHDLDHCALISRSWTPHARSITFRDICISQPKHMFKFVDLLASPHETISAAVKCMTIRGTRGWFEFFANVHDSKDAALAILEVFVTGSSLKFPNLEQLDLKNIAWENIPLSMQKAFIDSPNPFPSLVWIRRLELASCSFESYSQYWELIHAFPLLESLHHNERVDISFESVPSVVASGTTSRRPLRLRALRWHATDMISKGTWQNAATAFNALLLECGESLEELEFIVTQRYHHLDTLGLGTTQTLKDLFSMFDLTYTTRLRKLLIRNMASIKRESYDFLPAFLQNMTRTRSKSLRDLELRGFIPMKRRYDVDIPEGSSEEGDSEDQDESSSEEENHERAGTGDNEGLYEIPVDLMAMDTIFRDPFFDSLQRFAFGDFHCTFFKSEVKNQKLAGATSFERPDDDSIAGKRLNHAIDALKASFVGSGKAEILVPLINMVMHRVRRDSDNSLDDNDTDSEFDFERIPRHRFRGSLNWLRQFRTVTSRGY